MTLGLGYRRACLGDDLEPTVLEVLANLHALEAATRATARLRLRAESGVSLLTPEA